MNIFNDFTPEQIESFEDYYKGVSGEIDKRSAAWGYLMGTMSPSEPTQQPVDCRAAFEAWHKPSKEKAKLDHSGRYIDDWTQALWTGFSANWKPERESGDDHCQDCCCARCWKALGITEYTGKSIPEYITELREKAQAQEISFIDALIEAQKIVKKKAVFKKFIGGTPLENDIGVWMAEFLVKGGKP